MNIYLRWNSSLIPAKKTLPIFDLEISQEENNFAKAKIVIDALTTCPPTGTEGILYRDEEEIIFKGLLIGYPIKSENNLAEIELIAEPSDFLEKSMILQKEKRVAPFWDELWVKHEKHENYQEIQSVQTASLYCDRRTGELSWSDWFDGKQTLHIELNFFYESLSTKIIKAPLAACTIKVHTHWVQLESGVANLGPALAHAFPLRKISTYTKNSLLSKWPSSGKRLGRSGIWILKSSLKPVTPTSPLYPRFSPPLSLAEQGSAPKTYRFERYWFKPKMWVGWQTRQRRKETLCITLLHDYHPIFPRNTDHKILEFTLQHINPDPDAYRWQPEVYYREGVKVCFKNSVYRCCISHTSPPSFEESQKFWIFQKFFHTHLGDPARASFFLTDRGYRAAEHAMERAKVELAKSTRALEISFESSWHLLKDITTDTSVVLTDPRLPNGKVKGKVTKYALIAKEETGERIARVTLVCAMGTGVVKKTDVKSEPSYAIEEYCEEIYQIYENKVRHTPTGLTYFRYDDQPPPEREKAKSLLRGIEVSNGPDEQEAEMRRHYTPSKLKKGLSQKPTRLRLFFKDLRTKERIEHKITVRMAAAWGTPL